MQYGICPPALWEWSSSIGQHCSPPRKVPDDMSRHCQWPGWQGRRPIDGKTFDFDRQQGLDPDGSSSRCCEWRPQTHSGIRPFPSWIGEVKWFAGWVPYYPSLVVWWAWCSMVPAEIQRPLGFLHLLILGTSSCSQVSENNEGHWWQAFHTTNRRSRLGEEGQGFGALCEHVM